MKSKTLLPILAAGMMLCSFTACSDDSAPAAVVADPTVTDPVATDPTVTDPTVTDPAVNNPTITDPVVTDPVVTDPVVTDPIATDPILSSSSVDVIVSSSSVVVADPNVTYTYYGAELTGLEQFKYGRFEARMKMVSIPGSVSSMFLYYDDSHRLGDFVWNEIDIEVLGKTDTVWQANLITRETNETTKTEACVKDKNGDCRKITSESKPKFGFHATEDFHLYAMIWTPEYISWEIDSVEVRRDTIGFEKKPGHDQVAFMTEEQSLRFNLWVSGSTSWVGKFTGNELADGPKIQYIDYVRTYKYDEATKAFTLNWQDDFDGDDIDATRWSKGSWQMEKVWYRDENLIVKDGMCQMILSREAD